MDFAPLIGVANERLVLSNALPLGIAKPPFGPGVYALFHDGERVYVGMARGRKGLRNRKRNYVGGDEKHTTHRQFLSLYLNKEDRSAYIKENVSMAWFLTDDTEIAETLEPMLISAMQPAWNRIGKT